MGDISYHHHKKAENQKELMNITVDALEKQIPKKVEIEVVEDFDESTGEHYKWRFPKCSVCGEHIGLKMHKYCAYCGQALDWSDTE
jgi:rRNA maturation endonuclease Nob1